MALLMRLTHHKEGGPAGLLCHEASTVAATMDIKPQPTTPLDERVSLAISAKLQPAGGHCGPGVMVRRRGRQGGCTANLPCAWQLRTWRSDRIAHLPIVLCIMWTIQVACTTATACRWGLNGATAVPLVPRRTSSAFKEAPQPSLTQAYMHILCAVVCEKQVMAAFHQAR